jgi:hypothetical protein
MLAAGLIAGSYGAGRLLRAYAGIPGPAVWANDGETGKKEEVVALLAHAERVVRENQEHGTVYLNDKPLFTVETSAGGLTGYERSMIVAKRLNDAFAAQAVPEDFTASVAEGMNVILWRDKPLITVDEAQANALGKPRAEVAETWASAIRTTMRQIMGLPEPPVPSQAASQPGEQRAEVEATEWQPPEPYDDKDVPIISVGEGKQLGMARVKGPRSRVKLVQAVAAIETHYEKTLEIEIYVPISTKVPSKKLARIQGVGVVGIAKYKF